MLNPFLVTRCYLASLRPLPLSLSQVPSFNRASSWLKSRDWIVVFRYPLVQDVDQRYPQDLFQSRDDKTGTHTHYGFLLQDCLEMLNQPE